MKYFNQITEEIDKYKLYDNEPYCFNTYICQWKDDDYETWCIRFPGATRGHIKVDADYIISEIKLYADTCFGNAIGCYKKEVLTAIGKFIGLKLELIKTGPDISLRQIVT